MTITNPIFNMFARSPIQPLEEHMNKVQACVELLVPFFQAVLAKNWEEAEQKQHEIAAAEKVSDSIKKELRLHLPNNLFLPVPRSDLIETLLAQSRIADKAKDIAGIVVGRRLKVPEQLASDYMLLLSRCIDASRQATRAINELDELLETSFRGNEVKLVEEMVHQLDEIEQDTDKIQVTVRQKLFEIEAQLSPVDVVFLYKLIEWTGDLADRAQLVGGQLELLLAR